MSKAKDSDITDYEWKLLRLANGEHVPEITEWGAAMTVATEYLREIGYLEMYQREPQHWDHRLTDRGRSALKRHDGGKHG